MKLKISITALLLLALQAMSFGLVKFDDGRRTVLGIQLLQDYKESNVYYYIPTYPRLASNPDGTFDFLCLKYVDPKGKSGGGLFHCLVEFTLPDSALKTLTQELQKQVPGGRIAGPVPLLPTEGKDGGEENSGSFKVVSAILGDKGDKGMTRSVVTSGKAPVTPGSRAAIAAILNANGATLLWDSMSGPTSDVSVQIDAYYEAAVTGFEARITADVSQIYTHFSNIINDQQGYQKNQIRTVTDKLVRDGNIKVEVLDRTKGLDLKAGDMQSVVDVVTNKIVELMFDSKTGFSADPPREAAVEENQLLGRQEPGFFQKVFSGTGNQPYYTDHQFTLKKRTDVRQNKFSVVLTKNSTIKVPVTTSGNIHGFYDALKNDPRYFRVVNLADTAFEFRSIFFQVDGDFVSAFQDTINFVGVEVRKKYSNGNSDYNGQLRFTSDQIKDGSLVQNVDYPRLGETENWTDFEYRIIWSLRGRDSITIPAEKDKWISTGDPMIGLTPPVEKTKIDVDLDRGQLLDKGITSVVLQLEYPQLGTTKRTRLTLRPTDTTSTNSVVIYKDPKSKIKGKAIYYLKAGLKIEVPLGEGDDTYWVLTPPSR
ncbi:MAG: hypothetical protein WCI55_04380 [Armatimonadota bacterium]